MQQTELITVTEYCMHHHTDTAFVNALAENGLISVTIIEGEYCIHYDQLREIEGYTRLHDELNINPEGIDTIRNLLDRMKEMQAEIDFLRSRLKMYE